MLTDFAPASEFVPADLDAASWPALAPLYADLLSRDLHCANCLRRLIMDRSELDAAAGEAGSVLYINMTRHTDDAAAQKAYLDHVENVQPRLKQVSFDLDRKIVESPFVGGLDQGRYGVMLRDLRAAVELFRPENIPLETELARLDQQYSEICGAMTVHFRGRERTLTQMAVFNEDPDRATREEAWRLAAQRRFADAARIDAIFDRMVTLRRQIARNAGLPDFRAYAFKARRRFDYTPADCDAFAAGIERHVTPLVRRIMAGRARAMGVAQPRPWDGQADPKGRPALRPFEGAAQLVDRTRRVFARMDPDLQTMFDFLCEPAAGVECLDLESRKGKAPGGYQASRERMRVPFIFMNAAGVQRDVETLVHEAGHAFHTLLCRAEPLLHYRNELPLEFAEVASMSMELLAHPYFEEYYDAADAARARRAHLEQMLVGLATIAVVDQFQHWLYTTENDAPARHAKWAELQRRYGPGFDWTGLEDLLGASWHRVLHLFGAPFYYIEYGIAQLGALQVWLNARRDRAAAIGRYKSALALGGSRTLPELFAAAGLAFDFSPENIGRLTAAVEAELANLPS